MCADVPLCRTASRYPFGTVTTPAEVGAILHRLFIARDGTRLRKEDLQKTHEVAALIRELSRVRKGASIVDAAAGKSSVGLVAAEVLPLARLTVIERAPDRVAACLGAAARLSRAVPVDVREADVRDDAAWPEAPDAVVALHACGGASDRVIDQAVRVRTRWLFLVPCCYGASISFLEQALTAADRLGAPDVATLRRRVAASLVDVERALRLEAAGYETEVHELVGATITPHNLLFRARRTLVDRRMQDAARRLDALRGAAASPG